MSPIDYCLYSTKLFFTLLVRKNLYLNFFITSFSQYTTICFVSFVYSVFNEHFSALCALGGDDGIRTHDPLLAGQVLSQLSYTPILKWFVVFSVFCRQTQRVYLVGPSGLEPPLKLISRYAREKPLTLLKGSQSYLDLLVGPSGLEPPTSCLSGTRSNLLSYEPMWLVSDLFHLNFL